MTRHAIHWHGRNLLARAGINQAQIVIVLVRHQQQRRSRFCCMILSESKNRNPTH
jgi:hypothetical protein